jgi:hypothetical protein
MADYRLSVAQVGITKKMSDEIGAPYEQKLSLAAVHAVADAFLRLAGTARDQGIISDEHLVELRQEIGSRLRPQKAQKFTTHERAILVALGRCSEPVKSAQIAIATALPRPAVNFALHELHARGYVHRKMDGRTGLYWLAESAAEFRAESIRLGSGAILTNPAILSAGRR